MRFSLNEPVSYYRKNPNGTTDDFDAVVIGVTRKRVKISFCDVSGPRERWVHPDSLETQKLPRWAEEAINDPETVAMIQSWFTESGAISVEKAMSNMLRQVQHSHFSA